MTASRVVCSRNSTCSGNLLRAPFRNLEDTYPGVCRWNNRSKKRSAMLFNSYTFLFLFLPVAIPGFFILGRFGRRPAAAWLVAMSFVFYAWWNPPFVFLLLT